MGNIVDLTGRVFGRLTVINLNSIRSKDRSKRWNCDCECGNNVIVPARDLISEHTKSSGWMKQENKSKIHSFS